MTAKRKCKYCGEYGYDHIKIKAGSFCNFDHAAKWGIEKSNKDKEKALKEAEKDKRAKHREDKERIKTTKEWYEQLQKLVNQYVVHIRDKDKPCCTCGKSNELVKYDAGHYRSRGSCPELRFELTNIHKQCSVNCNVVGSGMRAEYREFIIAKYGVNHLEWLDGKHQLLKEKFPHYLDIKAEIIRYRKLIRENGLKPIV